MKSSFPLLASLTTAYQPARRWRRPEIGLDVITLCGRPVAVIERSIAEKRFCRLVHFARELLASTPRGSAVSLEAVS
jgi:poly-beta-hydroxyalkanoate depolymerase